MRHSYTPEGICVSEISFDINTDGVVSDIKFENGCDGNLKIISKIFDGKKAEEIISVCEGTTCDEKSTSCADQFSIALKEALTDKVS